MGGGADKGIPAPGWRGNARPQATHNATRPSRLPPAPPAALPVDRTRQDEHRVGAADVRGSRLDGLSRAERRPRVLCGRLSATGKRCRTDWQSRSVCRYRAGSVRGLPRAPGLPTPEQRQSARLPGQAATRSGREPGSLPTGCAVAPCAAAAACGLWRSPVRPPVF